MILFNKLFKNIDEFYKLASNPIGVFKFAETEEEKKERIKRRLEQKLKEKKELTEAEIKQKKLNELKEEAKALAEKVDIDPKDDELADLFQEFMKNYDEVIFRTQKLSDKTNELLKDVLREDYEVNEIVVEEILDKEATIVDAANALDSLNKKLLAFSKYDYLSQPPPKDEDDIVDNPWAEDFSAEYFMQLIDSLYNHARKVLEFAGEGELDLQEAVSIALSIDEAGRAGITTKPGKETGVTLSGDKLKQVYEAMSRYRSKMREAIKFGPKHEYWLSAVRYASRRKEYDKKIRQDPKKRAEILESLKKRRASYKQTEMKRDELIFIIENSNNPNEIARAKSRLKELELDVKKHWLRDDAEKYYAEQKDYYELAKKRKQKQEEAFKKSLIHDVERKRKIKESGTLRGELEKFRQKIASRRSGRVKIVKEKIAEQENTRFLPFKEEIDKINLKLKEPSISVSEKARLQTELKLSIKKLEDEINKAINENQLVIDVDRSNSYLRDILDRTQFLITNNVISESGEVLDIENWESVKPILIDVINTSEENLKKYLSSHVHSSVRKDELYPQATLIINILKDILNNPIKTASYPGSIKELYLKDNFDFIYNMYKEAEKEIDEFVNNTDDSFSHQIFMNILNSIN